MYRNLVKRMEEADQIEEEIVQTVPKQEVLLVLPFHGSKKNLNTRT